MSVDVTDLYIRKIIAQLLKGNFYVKSNLTTTSPFLFLDLVQSLLGRRNRSWNRGRAVRKARRPLFFLLILVFLSVSIATGGVPSIFLLVNALVILLFVFLKDDLGLALLVEFHLCLRGLLQLDEDI